MLDIPLFTTFCTAQLNSIFTLNAIYVLLLPALSTNIRLYQVLTTTILFLNLIVRHKIYLGQNLLISDSIVLFIAMLALELIFSNSLKIFDTKSSENIADDKQNILKCLEIALNSTPDAVLLLEID